MGHNSIRNTTFVKHICHCNLVAIGFFLWASTELIKLFLNIDPFYLPIYPLGSFYSKIINNVFTWQNFPQTFSNWLVKDQY